MLLHDQDPSLPRFGRFDGYELLRPLGEGGMGAVYLARDSALDRLVAIKFISAAFQDPRAQQRLLREARVIARLQHPNIVAIFRTGDAEGHPYIAYEYVEGRPLSALPRPQSWLRTLRIGLGLSRGLAAAHRAGILHRDIKPANVMLAASGEVKLLDFGLAKFTQRARVEQQLLDDWFEATAVDLRSDAAEPDQEPSCSIGGTATLAPSAPDTLDHSHEQMTGQGSLVGTPLYLAPEVWRGAPATRRSDLYALGLVLYELLVGGLPHAHLGTKDIARFVTQQDIPSLASRFKDLPHGFVDLIDRCIARDPRQRPESADKVRDVLESLASIYLPFGESATNEVSTDSARLTESFQRLSAHGQRLASSFYARLFTLDPMLRELFVDDLTVQHRMLMAALKLIIENIERPERMVPYLMELGRRHARYGVQPENLAVMGRALLDTLAQLDEEWTDATAQAWSQAYGHIAQIVQRGIESADAGGRSLRFLPRTRWEVPLITPQTQWAPVDGGADGDVAYQCVGRGALEILVLGEWVTHLEHTWHHPAVARFFRQLASFARVVLLDRRGCGLSSRTGPITLDHGIADIRAVLDATGIERPVLLGLGDGCETAALFAALRPERTRALILFGSGRCRIADGVQSEAPAEALLEHQLESLRAQWGSPMFIDTVAPSLISDASYRQWWASSLRQGCSPKEAGALWWLGAMASARSIVHGLRVPALLLHRAGDRFRPAADTRDLAARIPGARYVELAGEDHAPWAGDADSVLAEIHRFLDTLVTPPSTGRIVGCVLAVEAVPAPAHGAPAVPLRGLVAQKVARSQGFLMASEPDAEQNQILLGLFDGPRRALGCARAILSAARRAGYGARAGVDIGLLSADATAEDEAVQRAVALARQAAPGEALTSDAIRELTEGAGYSFLEHPGILSAHLAGPVFSFDCMEERSS